MQIVKRTLRIVGWLMLVSAIVLACFSLVIYLHARSFLRSAVRTQGLVTTLVPMDPEDARSVFGDESTNIPGPMYSYAYSFRDAQGAEHGAVSSFGSWPAEFKIGDTVTVLYLPEHPEKAELQMNFDPWADAVFAGQVAVLCLCLGLPLLLFPTIVRRFHREPGPVHAG